MTVAATDLGEYRQWQSWHLDRRFVLREAGWGRRPVKLDETLPMDGDERLWKGAALSLPHPSLLHPIVKHGCWIANDDDGESSAPQSSPPSFL